MATPLELNLEGLTAEQLRAAREFQQRLGGVRAARTAGAVPAASPLPGITDTTAQSAARATSGPASGAINPAPAATSAAANTPGFGSRVLNFAKRGVGALVRAGGAVQAGLGINDLIEGRTGAGAENVALGAATAIAPPVGIAGNLLASGRDFVMQKVIDKVFGENKTFLPQSKAVKAPGTGVTAARAPVNAEALIRGTGVPAAGTGAFRRGRGRAVAVDSRAANEADAAAAATSPAVAAAPAIAAPIVLPSLRQGGDPFRNHARLGTDILKTALQIREQNLGAKAATARSTAVLEGAKLGISAENALSQRISARASAKTAESAGLSLSTDLQGNQVIVNKGAGTATQPTVTKQPSAADVKATAKKNGITEQQVIRRLINEGRLNPTDRIARQFLRQ